MLASELIGFAVRDVALIDRLTHHVEILLLEGRSYRRREAEISQQERNRQRPHRDDAPQ